MVKINYHRTLLKSSGKLYLPESSRLHKFISAHAKLNRQTREIKRPVTDGKQTTAARSNRQFFQKRGFCVRPDGCDVRVPQPPDAYSPPKRPFLTGFAPQTEFDVTHSKQTLGKILTGARMHIKQSLRLPGFGPSSGERNPTKVRSFAARCDLLLAGGAPFRTARRTSGASSRPIREWNSSRSPVRMAGEQSIHEANFVNEEKPERQADQAGRDAQSSIEPRESLIRISKRQHHRSGDEHHSCNRSNPKHEKICDRPFRILNCR